MHAAMNTARAFSRRRFLAAMPAFPAIIGLRASAQTSGKTTTVTILNTTDLHGHILPTSTYEGVKDVGGLARCATQIAAWRKECPGSILIDIGDVYQGTHVSRTTNGQVMIDLFNRLNYDAWVIGNHEFDWGFDAMAKAVAASKMPVLASNAKIGGVWSNRLEDKSNPMSRIAPYIVKEVSGFKVGIIGSVTPGLPSWLHPDMLKDFLAADPVSSVKFAIRKLQELKVDAIVLATHFGLKGVNKDGTPRDDDFANRINECAKECAGIDVIMSGHTHRDIPSAMVNGIPYTQANYFGINMGRVDLVFDTETRKLVDRKVQTKLMDSSIALDPAVLSATAKDLEASKAECSREIGEVKDVLSHEGTPGKPPPALLLITRSIRTALEQRNVKVQGVLHGLFQDQAAISAGKKTIQDAWDIIPYENRLATIEVTGQQLKVIVQEAMGAPYSTSQLDGFRVETEGEGRTLNVKSISTPDGAPVDPGKRYSIALNAFDAQSGGQRYKVLREIVTTPDAKHALHPIESRDALITYFNEKKVISAADLQPV